MEELGAAIKKRRLAKKMTQAELGKKAALDHTSVSHIEKGTRVPHRDTFRRIDKTLEAHGAIFKLRDELDDSPDAERVRSFLTNQSRANVIYHVGNHVPAMLETEEHTRMALEAGLAYFGGDLEDKLAYRSEMREILKRPDPPLFKCVLWESALQVVAGGTTIMRDQLHHLIERSREPNIELHVLPFAESAGAPDVGTVIVWEGPNDRLRAWRDTGNSFGTFINGRTEVSGLMNLYDHVRSRALAPGATRELIRKAAEGLYPCLPPDSTCP
ncbi:Scr1 family TA system antitoxin-like transcriptional regulator [Streptomyces luteireticuli]|uniref:helix-turn-helix domain-containing protein n=1 Tax=Streptomyces luteireticuli TaxID=173858 RepID=UPI0035568E01